MNRNTIVAVAAVALLAAIGVTAAATGAGSGAVANENATQPVNANMTNVDAAATLDNGTLGVTVTDDGAPAANVTVTYEDQTAITDENGTVTFEASPEESVELELGATGFEGELTYAVHDGTLSLVKEEYEYGHAEDGPTFDPHEAAEHHHEHSNEIAEQHHDHDHDDRTAKNSHERDDDHEHEYEHEHDDE
ncbi:MAG: hypothetical protein ABEI57_07875 [Halapricum sp.]